MLPCFLPNTETDAIIADERLLQSVQKYVKNVQVALDAREAQKFGTTDEHSKRKEERAKRREWEAEVAELFKPAIDTRRPQVAAGRGSGGGDPKDSLCEYFKQGRCARGKKCKLSHDMSLLRKDVSANLYTVSH